MTDMLKKRLIAKIHVAKKELGMGDDDYRAFLQRVAGAESSRDLSIRQLNGVLEAMKELGFKPKTTFKKTGISRNLQDNDPQHRKIRGMWITLHKMGEVRDPSEAALARFVFKMTGIERLQWLTDSRQTNLIINAMRGWIRRAGGDPDAY